MELSGFLQAQIIFEMCMNHEKVTIFETFQTVFISLTSSVLSPHVPVGAWLYTAAAYYKVFVQLPWQA